MNQHFRKIKLIVNPKSGRGVKMPYPLEKILGFRPRAKNNNRNVEDYIAEIQKSLKALGLEIETSVTAYGGHGTEIARECAEQGYDLVIACGGDGTINEVINGLAESDTALAVIPLGTANVFAIEMGSPVKLEDICQMIAAGETRKIDLGLANDRYFACMLGVGYDAHILKMADSELKGRWGAMAYAIAGTRNLLKYRFRKIRYQLDDEEKIRKGRYLFVCNGKFYGGGMELAPDADPSDGLLDVCVLKKKGLINFIRYLYGIWRGKVKHAPGVKSFRCRKVSILKKGKHPVHVDAEYLGKTPVKIEVRPLALKVCVSKL
jgi:YegS/Rv2252/BmrU family lipid kinase